MGIFPFNRNKYARELSCRERYHTRELMSFHFIFVANFIRDKNPLYGMYLGKKTGDKILQKLIADQSVCTHMYIQISLTYACRYLYIFRS